MLNSEIVLDEARAFAGRLLRDHPRGEAAEIVPAAYRLALSRPPTDDELTDASLFLIAQEAALSVAHSRDVLLPIGGFPKFLPPVRAAAIIDFCHALMNCNEFVYLD
jgi:hypothetical protein